jgi:HEAT repeat protein
MLWFFRQKLKSRNVATRRKAAHDICRKPLPDANSVEALLTALKDADAEVRTVAMTGIGKSDDPRRGDAIRRCLNDADPSVRNAAILAAKRLKDPNLNTPLAGVLLDADYAVRASAAIALEALGWHPETPAQEIQIHIARGQLHRAAAFGDKAIASLEQVLNSGPVSLRAKAVDALSRIDDEKILKPLLASLKSADTPVVVAAADAIGKIGNPDLGESLVPLLKHKEPLPRTTAADALGKLGLVKHADAIAALLKDSHWDTRRAAADSLAKLKSPRAVPALAEALKDADGDVREACAMAIGAIRDRSGIPPLVLALGDSASSVRRIAAAALSRIDEAWSASPEAAPALEQLKTIEAAKPAGIRTGSTGQGLRKHSESGLTTSPASAVDPEKNIKHAVSLFTAVLNDPDRDLRQAAVESLARIGGQRAEAVLSRALRDADAGVQRAAELALKQFAKPASAA